MISERLRAIVLIVGLVASGSACGFFDDVQEKVETVDAAVTLLQDISDSSTWKYVSDGLEALDEQGEGYLLTVQLQTGQIDTAGAFVAPLEKDTTLTIQVDADYNALIDIRENGQTHTYFAADYRTAIERSPVYALEDGSYTCVTDAGLWQRGPGGIFEEYAISAVGVQLLSVVEKDADAEETVATRDTIRYALESRVSEALDILKRIDNDELQTKVNAAGTFDLDGALYLDDETLALLRYESVYTDLAAQHRTEFSFEITQWGDVPDISTPAELTTPCE